MAHAERDHKQTQRGDKDAACEGNQLTRKCIHFAKTSCTAEVLLVGFLPTVSATMVRIVQPNPYPYCSRQTSRKVRTPSSAIIRGCAHRQALRDDTGCGPPLLLSITVGRPRTDVVTCRGCPSHSS
ncbi:unnamed protein product, partial [Scytosiphon promiscuus]